MLLVGLGLTKICHQPALSNRRRAEPKVGRFGRPISELADLSDDGRLIKRSLNGLFSRIDNATGSGGAALRSASTRLPGSGFQTPSE